MNLWLFPCQSVVIFYGLSQRCTQEVEWRERRDIGVKCSGTEAEENFSLKIRTGVQRDLQHSPQMEDAEAPLSMELVPDAGEKQKEDEHMDESKEPFDYFVKITHADIPGKGNAV